VRGERRDPRLELLLERVLEFVAVQEHQDEPGEQQACEQRLEPHHHDVGGEVDLHVEVAARVLDERGQVHEHLRGVAEQEPAGQREVRLDEGRVQLDRAAHIGKRLRTLARLLGQEAAAIEQPRLRGKRGDLP
jgi:hypothetical protein